MIIRTNKDYEINSNFPSRNPYPDEPDNIVIDETTEEGEVLAEKIMLYYPYYEIVQDAEGKVTDILEMPDVPYSIDKPTITTAETSVITLDVNCTATIDGQEYPVDVAVDNTIEYSNVNVGMHEILLIADGYKPTTITVEVVEA